MSFYNTGNPVPSIDPRDLDDNAKHIDELTNSTFPTFVDRLGTTRRTLAGIEADADAATLRGDLAAPDGSGLVGYQLDELSTLPRTVPDALGENPSIKDFKPSAGSGVSDDSAAALTMASVLGYVRFPRGNYVLNTCTIDADVMFDRKASITVNSPNIVTLTGTIDSCRQFIFKGTGQVLLRNDTDSGENSQQIHVSWFGAKPVVRSGEDQAPFLQKLCAALDNTREANVKTDKGRYPIGSTVTWPRSTWLEGMGSRRTVFELTGDGYVMFNTAGNGVRLTGFQVELSNTFPGGFKLTEPVVQIDHQSCETDDIWISDSNFGILVNGGSSTIRNTRSTYTQNGSAGSYLVSVRASDVDVFDTELPTSDFGPETLVEFATTVSTNISASRAIGVRWTGPGMGVAARAATGSLANCTAQNMIYRGVASSPATRLAHLLTSGTGSIQDFLFDVVSSNNQHLDGIRVEQTSGVSLSGVSVLNAKMRGTRNGVERIRTAGTLSDINIGSGVSLGSFSTPIADTGTVSLSTVDPRSRPGSNGPESRVVSIADDSVYAWTGLSAVFAGKVSFQVGVEEYGNYSVRLATTANNLLQSKSTNVASSQLALTGTTGVDGQVTLGTNAGTLYIENRLGATKTVNITLDTGTRV